MTAPHRYWRALAFNAGGANLSLSEFNLYDSGGRVDGTATLTANVAPASGSLSSLSDGSAASPVTWTASDLIRLALQWDFGAGVTKAITDLRLGAGATSAGWPSDFILQWSDDGATWRWSAFVRNLIYPGASSLQTIQRGDPNAANVVLLLRGDGANNSTTFTDSSPIGGTVTVGGNTVNSTADYIGGTASIYFDGNGDYLSVPDGSHFTFGTGDWTVEMWVNPDVGSTGGGSTTRTCLGQAVSTGNYPFNVRREPSGAIGGYAINSSGTSFSVQSLAAIPEGTWSHVAWQRRGTALDLYLNGNLVGSATLTGSTSVFDAAAPMCIGAYSVDFAISNPTACWKGYLDGVRITKGVARYTPQSFSISSPDIYSGVSTAVVAPSTKLLARSRAASQSITQSQQTRGAFKTRVRDIEFAGKGRINGTVKTKGTPDQPVHRKVRLIRERDGIVVRETWSDAVTGNYSFAEIDETKTYTVVAYDYDHNFRAVIADNLTPELM